MEQERSPLRNGRRLTPTLFDLYVARARADRAKAIAEFGPSIAAWLARAVMRLVRRAPGAGGTSPVAGAPTVR